MRTIVTGAPFLGEGDPPFTFSKQKAFKVQDPRIDIGIDCHHTYVISRQGPWQEKIRMPKIKTDGVWATRIHGFFDQLEIFCERRSNQRKFNGPRQVRKRIYNR